MSGVLAQKVLYSAGLLALEGARNGIYGAVNPGQTANRLEHTCKILGLLLSYHQALSHDVMQTLFPACECDHHEPGEKHHA